MKKPSFFALILLLLITLTLAACDSTETATSKKSDPQNTYPRAVNNDEATKLSRTLFHNTELANATFSLTCGVLGNGGFAGEGIVDWKNNLVATRVSLNDISQIDIGSIATTKSVFESVLDLNQTLSDAGFGSYNWVKREFNPSEYGIDSISQFILKLGATAPDNPILLKQNGATILGVENVNEVKTYKMRNVGTITYYVSEDETLMRIEAVIKGFNCPIRIDFFKQGESKVETPLETDAISIDKVLEIYTKIRPTL